MFFYNLVVLVVVVLHTNMLVFVFVFAFLGFAVAMAFAAVVVRVVVVGLEYKRDACSLVAADLVTTLTHSKCNHKHDTLDQHNFHT